MSQIYRKDSFDRFGDDLCQHLLSFLSLEDRFPFECLSKHWRRFIFKTNSRLIISRKLCNKLKIKFNDYTAFELMLKKLPNITAIECTNVSIDNNMFELIIKYCCHLNTINVKLDENITVHTIDMFFIKYDKQLNAIEFKIQMFTDSEELQKGKVAENMKLCEKV